VHLNPPWRGVDPGVGHEASGASCRGVLDAADLTFGGEDGCEKLPDDGNARTEAAGDMARHSRQPRMAVRRVFAAEASVATVCVISGRLVLVDRRFH
jgi:hypothetical protein